MVLVLAVSNLGAVGATLIGVAGTALTSALTLRVRLTGEYTNIRPARDATALPGSGERSLPPLEAVPLAILIVGRQRDIRWANAAAKSLLECNPTGRPLLSILRNPGLVDALEALWRSGGVARPVDVALPGERDLVVNLAMFGQGPDSEALVLLRDVSGEKRLEMLRRDFIANVSHELKTPIAALLGFIETMRGPARDDAEAHERFLPIMMDQARRMDRLVADLLSLSRIELLEHERPTEEVDLGRILKTVADTLAIRIKDSGMTMSLPERERWPRLKGAADELVQVFQNLVENAIKYGRSGTAIEIEIDESSDPTNIGLRLPALREATGVVSITIKDHGQGIAKEHLPRLTERFYRVDPARSRELGGTGLGLAIVKHIVNRHRGSLTIESEPGRGSVFTVHLPAATVTEP